MEDEDYWNTSETKAKAFSFDDDVLTPQEILAIGQKPTQSSTNEDTLFNQNLASKAQLLPINTLLSPKLLDLIILAQSGKDPSKIRKEAEETVSVSLTRLTLGRSCMLHVHRSLKSKTELLDGAIAIGDGNAILAVVLFIIQTLNKKLVSELLGARPQALAHYVSFLQNEGRINELSDLLTMLGRSSDAAMQQFQHVVSAPAPSAEQLARRLSGLLANHFSQPPVDAHHARMLTDYIKLLEWQRLSGRPELQNESALRCLAYCCAHHWHEGAGNLMSPLTTCQRQQISPLQYEWVALGVLAACDKWDVVEALITKKDWLGRSTLSSRVPLEALLARLRQLGASSLLLAACLNKLASLDDRLRLAHAYKVHAVVIETLARQKDRLSLTNYKMALNPQSEEYMLAENTLRDLSIKWKELLS